jgi:hypothetical protein
MGYYVSMQGSASIPADKADACLEAINHLHTPEMLAEHARGGRFDSKEYVERWYSWVDNPPNGRFETLKNAIEAWNLRFEEPNDEWRLVSYDSESKMGQEEFFFQTIAPFVAEGSFECEGEDGHRWRYVFLNGKLLLKEAKVVWV